ncbi:hypothetical protein JG688_00003850 [Phytophthora aleatoria]|uniref:Uncharacterized protein n=1 Tax=Phytophthora aleatoria TaxID=2496075 RepID=A0A8J5JEK3_9STRA|nr:hypothetical protein JG688_00003850 [Phytophthora aleatoria]
MKQPSHRGFNVHFGLVAWLLICFSMGFMIGSWTIKAIGGEAHNVLHASIVSLKHSPTLRQNDQPRIAANNSLAETTASSRETLAMGQEFYTSNFDANDTSATIIFNVFRGEPEALRMQLEAALNQNNVVPPDVWVMCFNSPKRLLYEAVVSAIRVKYPERGSQLKVTASDFNHKFHGRFLLAYMATTKYVLIVDDDRPIDSTTVYDYIQYMQHQKGVWGNFGHRRASTFEGYKSWPWVGYNLSVTDMEEQDYLCGMWFLEQTWLEYFVKERMPSWATSEDMHLSHVMRKYLNLNTYGGKVALSAPSLPSKEYAATTGSALDLREFIFDHQLGRGNKVANVDQPIDTLVYAETARDIEDFLLKLEACPSGDALNATEASDTIPWCHVGRTAAVFRGAKEQDVNGLIAAAEELCAKTDCECFSVKPNIRHGIRYFNMREGYGQASTGVEIPFQTGASDVMLSLVGILNNVLPEKLFVPDAESMSWSETDATKRNRLQIYHQTVLLAVEIHRNSKTNGKWRHRNDETDEFPTDMKMFGWQSSDTDMSGGGEYPYPKYTWSPAGGWWAKTKNWQRKTGVALVALAAVAGPIALFSSSNHIKFPAEERRKL